MDEFKEFLKTIPSIKQDVLNGRYTWLRKENGMMNEEIRYYLRYHPNWYIVLSRYPQEYEHLIQEYKDGKNQQFIDKIDQVSMLINMVEMMM